MVSIGVVYIKESRVFVLCGGYCPRVRRVYQSCHLELEKKEIVRLPVADEKIDVY